MGLTRVLLIPARLLLFSLTLRVVQPSPAAGEAVLTPGLTVDTLDAKSSYALPGRTPPSLKVLRIGGIANHAEPWRAETVAEPADAQFVIALKTPIPVGTVLVSGRWKVSYLKPEGTLDATKEDQWTEASYPGGAGDDLRVVPLPAGVATKAIRLTGRCTPDSAGKFSSALGFATTFAARLANVAPLADVSVSSSAPQDQGFRPNPKLNDPDVLNDGSLAHRNWSSGKRDVALSREKPEWIVLDWGAPRRLRGCAAFIGGDESGFATVLVQRWTAPPRIPPEGFKTAPIPPEGFTPSGGYSATPFPSEGFRPSGGYDEGWQTLGKLEARRPWRPIVWEAYCDFGKDIETRALRFLAVAGTTKEIAAGGEGANPTAVSLGEILVFEDLANSPAPARIAKEKKLPDGVIPLAFTMPQAGRATIQILDEKGEVVENLAAGREFPAGPNTVWWDLRTLNDYWPPYSRPAPHFPNPDTGPKVAVPGRYHWRGLWHPGLSLHYLFSYNPLRTSGLAWITADTTGGWLADHVPPQDVVRTGDTMWCGTFCEAGHALLEADLKMIKLWGSERIWLACPRCLAADGDFVYFVEQGGWVRDKIVMVQVNRKTKASRRLLGRDIAKDEKTDIQGLAVVGHRAFLADRAKNLLLVLDISKNLEARPAGFSWDIAWKLLDHERMTVIREVPLERPGRIRPYGDRHLAAVSGARVVLIDRETFDIRPIVTGLTNPLGLGIDSQGNFYVGEMDPVHQVKVFSPDGKLIRTIGRPGPHRVGPFDPDNLESPAGIDIDANGNVWVCEFNPELKRTSVWDKDGHCVNQVIGPPVYGGGGEIDPGDENHLFYRGQEYRRDPATSQTRLAALLWRADDKTYDQFGSYPSYPFRRDGKLFFTSFQGWADGANTTLWVYDSSPLPPGEGRVRDAGGQKTDGSTPRLRSVAAVGTLPAWLRERLGRPKLDPKNPDEVVFAWTDLNGDGKVQPDELRTGKTTFAGKPWDRVGCTWQFRMNEKFECAVSDGQYGAAGIAFFRVERLTPEGYPVYALPTEFRPIPGLTHASDAVFTDRDGNAISLDEYIVSMRPDGQINWRYRSRWPGLHAGHSTTAAGDEPGVVIAPTRFLGSGWVNNEVGEVLVIGSNLGATDLFTADGLYVDRVFRDCRKGLSWRMNAPPSDEIMNQVSLGDEHFGGTFQRVSSSASSFGVPPLGGSSFGVPPLGGLSSPLPPGEGRVRDCSSPLPPGEGRLRDAEAKSATAGLPSRERAAEPTAKAPDAKGTVGQADRGTPGDRGAPKFLYVVGQPHSSVVQLNGLDGIHRLPGAGFEVTQAHFLQAEKLRQQRAYATSQPKTYTIRRLQGITIDGKPDDWPKDRLDAGDAGSFALGYSDSRSVGSAGSVGSVRSVLYVLFEGRDDRAVFQNASTDDNFLDAFKRGDVVDVMLETKPGLKPDREDAAEGDIRLSFTMIGGKPSALLYDYVVPGTPKEARLPFASPWRTLWIDRVARIPDAQIAVTRHGDRYCLEAAVPLASIHLNPAATPRIRGDVGRVLSDQTGTRAVARLYWSNHNTAITADLPSEARLQPNLWGTFVFER